MEKKQSDVKHKIIAIIAKLDNGSHSSSQLQGIDEALFELFDEQNREGKTISLQGTARIATKMTNYGRDMQHRHQILKDARRIQPLPDDVRHDTLKPEYRTRTARAIAAVRHTANNAWIRFNLLFPPWSI